MTDTLPASPIIETLQRIRTIASYVKVNFGLPQGEDWQHMPALLADDAAVDRWLATIRSANHTDDRHYQGVTIMGAAWLPITAALAGLYSARRVPDITPHNVWLRFSDHGFLDEIALVSTRYMALCDDADAQHDPDAALHPTWEALRDAARRQIEAYAAPLVELAYRRTTLGRRAGWSTAADRCAQTIITTLRMTGRSSEVDAEVQGFLAGSPLKGRTGVLWVEKDDRCEPFLGRGACCLSYKLPADYGYCSTCPLLSVEERKERLRARMG